MDDFDSPWKEFLDEYLDEFLAFSLPSVHSEINWQRGYESLDKELQQLDPSHEEGRRIVDKLFKVWTIEGTEAWLLLHIEVQNQRTEDFPLRMYVYSYRIFDRFRRHAISVAILGDDDPHWRPQQYVNEFLGCGVELRFPTIKLLDYSSRIHELEQSQNPAALVILAHLNALSSRRNGEKRLALKKHLVRILYERGWSPDRVRRLFKFIDWLMKLPKDLSIQFRQDLESFEKENQMPYVTSVEELAREEGLEQGLERGRVEGRVEFLLTVVEKLFGAPVPPEVAFRLRQITDLDQLTDLQIKILRVNSFSEALEEINQVVEQ